ncbi:zinc finger domain-containing protein [Apiospora arundinis]|uniref:Zinc finger domain-containing protein n=1 Tax=Apiospora arundinis TaxID=335852 RepID=A0ABR2IHB4_9PEZI
MPPMIPAERICIACEKVDGKYKCTKCAKYTCSLPCSKAHREVHDNEPQPPNAGAEEEEEPEGGHSPLSKLFKKYPELPQQLRDIADATDPPKDDKSGGGNSRNNRFNPRGGRGGGGNKRQEPWTKEIGLQNGMNLLRRNLASPSPQQSEGLREYCELFKHEMAQKAEQGEDPDALFRRRAAEHDAEVIRRLMEEEESHKD